MLRKSGAFVILAMMAALLTWNAPAALAQDAKTVLGNASKAMGADNLKSIQYSGTATEFSFGQAVNPSAAWPAFVEKSYARTISYETPAWRVEKVLADIPPDRKGGGLPPAAMQTVIVGPNTPWATQVDLWMTPHGFLQYAAKNNATATTKSMDGKKYITHNTIKNLEEKVSKQHFLKVHRSYIVNLHKIDDMRENLLFIKGNEIPVSKANKADVFRRLNIV